MKLRVFFSVFALSVNMALAAQSSDTPALSAQAPFVLSNELEYYLGKCLTQLKPLSIGILSGLLIGALETELIDPLLAGLSDNMAIGAQVAGLSCVGGLLYANQENEVVQDMQNPTTALGLIAGLLVWYRYAGALCS